MPAWKHGGVGGNYCAVSGLYSLTLKISSILPPGFTIAPRFSTLGEDRNCWLENMGSLKAKACFSRLHFAQVLRSILSDAGFVYVVLGEPRPSNIKN